MEDLPNYECQDADEDELNQLTHPLNGDAPHRENLVGNISESSYEKYGISVFRELRKCKTEKSSDRAN